MKITCDSCGAKYTIADEKVQGRRVKVRCKNCKANILVDGTSGGAPDALAATEAGNLPAVSLGPAIPASQSSPAAGAGPASRSSLTKTTKKNTWSVNLTDDDSREMTTEELVAAWKEGLVTAEAYVWKEGMGDWKPVLEVPELKLRLKALTPTPPAVSPARPAAPPLKASTPKPAPTRATTTAQKREDLFGGADFAKPPVKKEPEPAPEADAQGTGARNESSVLFSLDALTTKPAEKEKKDDPVADLFGGSLGGGMSPLGGGGLLTSTPDLLTAPAQVPPTASTSGAAAAHSPAPSSGSNKTLLVALLLLGVAVLGGGAYFALSGNADQEAQAQALAEAEEKAKAEAEAKLQAAEEERKRVEEQLKKAEEERKRLEEEKKKAEEALQAAENEKKEEEEEDKKEPAASTGSTASRPSTSTGSSSSSTTKKAAETKAPAAASGGSAFDTAAARTALANAAAQVNSCKQAGDPAGSGRVQVTFAPSGRVSNAELVSGPFGGSRIGGCVVSKFRQAKVPAFSGAPVTVARSFSIK